MSVMKLAALPLSGGVEFFINFSGLFTADTYFADAHHDYRHASIDTLDCDYGWHEIQFKDHALRIGRPI
jgi:hypothetical protein